MAYWLVAFVIAIALLPACTRKGPPYNWKPSEPPASGTLAVAWDPPRANADGTPLEDLAGYRLHWGPASGEYDRVVDVGDTLQAEVPDERRPLYMAVTAYDTAGNESRPSAELAVAK